MEESMNWDEIIKTERYSDEMDYHEGLGYIRGYNDACKYFLDKFKEKAYWDTNHTR